MVWVVDPQKYADGLLHEHYLRPFAAYGDSMLVVLNQADRLAAAGRDACIADLGRLLAADGLPRLPVLATSALTGEGLAELRSLLEQRVAAREAAVARLAADVATAASGLALAAGAGAPGKVERGDRAALTAALADAAGVPEVIRAVASAHRRRGALATGWPFVRWLRRLRPDPLRRLRLPDRVEELPAAVGGDAAPGRDAPGAVGGGARSSLPAPTRVQRAQVETAARSLAGRAAGDLPDPWPGLVRRAALAREDELAGRLEAAVSGADLRMRTPRWWRAAGLLQALLAALAVAGALWLLALAALGYLQVDDVVPTPEVEGFPVPTLLLGGAALAGLVLAAPAGLLVKIGARRRARVAEKALQMRVRSVGEELVVARVEAELDAHQRLRQALDVAGPAPRNQSFVTNLVR